MRFGSKRFVGEFRKLYRLCARCDAPDDGSYGNYPFSGPACGAVFCFIVREVQQRKNAPQASYSLLRYAERGFEVRCLSLWTRRRALTLTLSRMYREENQIK